MINYVPLPETRSNEIKIENKYRYDTNMPLTVPLEVVFSHDISTKIDAKSNFKIYPDIKGNWIWKDARTIQYKPEEDWPAGYQGIFEIVALQSIKPNLILKPAVLSFKTEPFVLVNSFQSDSSHLNSREVKIALEFNAKIDPFKLNSFLSIKNKQQNRISFSLFTKEPSKKIEIVMAPEYVDQINLQIEKELSPLNGKPLGEVIQKTILCSKAFVVNYVKPSFENNIGCIEVFTNKKEDNATIRRNLKILPEIPVVIEYSWNGFLIKGDFKGEMQYTLYFDKNLNQFNSPKEAIEEILVKFPPKPAFIDFADSGIIYGLKGNQNIEISSTNVDRVHIRLFQIPTFNYNLFLQIDNYNKDILSEELYSQMKHIAFTVNQNMNWSIPFKEMQDKLQPGFYEMEVKVSNEQFLKDRYSNEIEIRKKIIITDIGVSCRKSHKGLFFWVNRLSDLAAIQNAEIKLFSASNTLLMETKTDQNGISEIKVDKKIFQKLAFVLVQSSGDFTYLKLTEDIRQNHGDEKNAYPSENYNAFINIERNVFRPGEKIEIDGVVRNRTTQVPPAFPVEVEIRSSDNKSIFKKAETLDLNGCFHLNYEVSEIIQGGQYTIQVSLADKTIIGYQNFEISSFFPQRLNGKINLLNKNIVIDEPIEFEIQCEYLSGLSAEGLRVESHVCISELPDFAFNNTNGYEMGYHSQNAYNEYFNLPNQSLNKDGKLNLQYIVPKLKNPDSRYAIHLRVLIFDKGGREYLLSKQVEYYPQKQFLGIKYVGKEGEKSKFEIKCFDCKGELVLVDSELEWSLIERQRKWVLVKRNEYYTYELSEEENIFFKGKLQLIQGVGELSVSGTSLELQEMVVSNQNLKANLLINQSNLVKPKNPYEIHFDKITSVKPGSEIKVNITVPFLGKALVCLENNEIESHQVMNFNQNKMELPIFIPENARGSVHISCTLLQSQLEINEIKSYRAKGMCKILLDHSDKKLKIVSQAPAKINSSADFIIPCQVVNYEGKPVDKARVIVSVMDKAIRNIKGEYTPDTYQAFYGPHRSVIEEYDFYGDVVYEKIKMVDNLLPGGGGGSDNESVRQEKFVSFKERIKLARWQSGVLETNENGEVICTVPGFDYQGKLDYQVWSLQSDQFGYLNNEIIVRDEVILEETFPKYAYANDVFSVPILMQNLEEVQEKVLFSVTSTNQTRIKNNYENEFLLEPKAVKNFNLDCEIGNEEGSAVILIQWAVNNKKMMKKIQLPIVSRKSLMTVVKEGMIINNEKQFVESSEVIEAKNKISELRVTASPFEQLRGTVDYLINYPYGCGEQTVSKLMPMVYSKPLLELSTNVKNQKEIDFFIKEGLVKLQRYQDRSGGIRIWDGNISPDIFVSAYCGYLFHHLANTGVNVDKTCISSLNTFLKDEIKNKSMDKKIQCFILYVLALHGEFQKVFINDLLLLKPKLDRSSACFLYMAGILTGIEMPKWEDFSKNSEYYQELDSSGFYGSYARDVAIELIMANDFDVKINANSLVIKLLSLRSQNGHWGSSQANSWCYFALMKYLQNFNSLDKPEWKCEVMADGNQFQGSNEKGLLIKKIINNKLSIQKDGPGLLYYSLTEKGFAKTDQVDQISNGIKIEKEFISIHNLLVEDGNNLEKGKSYIVRLKILSETDIENVVIQEFFPAGVEYSYIDQKEFLKASVQKNILNLLSSDIKDDRMYLFPEKLIKQVTYEFCYCVRATTKGEFFLPTSKVEAMYNAAIFGQAKTSLIKIK